MKQYIYIVTILLLSSVVFAQSAKEIIESAEKAIRGNTSKSTVTIAIKTRRWERTLKLVSYDNRLKRMSFAEILAPKKDAGNRFLLIKDNMWHYVPKLQQTIKIAPSMMLQSWMGSDFTNDDIVKQSSLIDDYTHTLEGREIIDGIECFKVVLVPKPNVAVVWGKIVYYASVSQLLPVREEFYNEHNQMTKLLTCSNVKMLGGREIPTVYIMKTIAEPDRYTKMEIVDIQFDIALSGNIFSFQNLQRK
ncbi:MAG TPA: outer membrane lipoprotein-sorting protein [Spirochaetota bacterium]|nr:outer membrane lipoprotein-sorting protein [Spirochaetota bacterium]